MNLFDIINFGFTGRGSASGGVVRMGLTPDGTNAGTEPDSLTVLYTCIKILADNFSRLPLQILDKNGTPVDHNLTDLFNTAPNGYQNGQVLKGLSEWDRGVYGNSFFVLDKGALIHLPSQEIKDAKVEGRALKYQYQPLGTNQIKTDIEPGWIEADKVFHFRGVSGDGVFGLSPLSAAHSTYQLMQNANKAVTAFYRNDAMATHAIESALANGDPKALLAARKMFQQEHAGVENAGKHIRLNVGEKIVPLSVKFHDAELIATMEYSRDTITSMYGIPNYMLSANDSTQNVEQQTRAFVSVCMANIANIYEAEINRKGLTQEERKSGLHAKFNLDVLVEVTFGDKVNALKEAVGNFLMSPNEAIKRLTGGPKISGKYGDYHFGQAQMIPLEEFEKSNPLVKETTHPSKQLNSNNS